MNEKRRAMCDLMSKTLHSYISTQQSTTCCESMMYHDAAISINFNIRLSQTLITFRRYFIVHIMIFAMMVWIISCFVCQHNFIAISVLHLALNPLHFFMIAAFARVHPHQMQQKKRFMILHHFISRFFCIISRTN